MAIVNAIQLRKTLADRVIVRIPGTDHEILCRSIDPYVLVYNAKLEPEQLGAALPIMAGWQGMKGDAILKSLVDNANVLAPVIDALVVAASVAPKVTLTKPDDSNPDQIWLDDLPITTRIAILFATTTPVLGEQSVDVTAAPMTDAAPVVAALAAEGA